MSTGSGGIYTANADITLYAVWTADSYTLTLMDGATESASTVVAYGSTTNLPVLEKTGYTFDGWYDDAAGTTAVTTETGLPLSGVGTYTDASGQWILTADTSLYAQWTADSYPVYYPTDVAGVDGYNERGRDGRDGRIRHDGYRDGDGRC